MKYLYVITHDNGWEFEQCFYLEYENALKQFERWLTEAGESVFTSDIFEQKVEFGDGERIKMEKKEFDDGKPLYGLV